MSKPRGTLKYSVGETSRSVATVRSMRPGAGLPSSITSVPPWNRTRLKLWLAPKVWLQGSQSTTTGGRARRKGQSVTIASWFEQSIRWVVITPLGAPVEPDVKRILATLSGPSEANTASISGRGVVARRSPTRADPSKLPRLVTTSAEARSRARP